MSERLVRRLLGAIATVLAVSFVAYAALTFASGDAAQALLGEHASTEQLESFRRQMQLDAPLLERYGNYIAAAVTRGDLGRSLISGRRVADLLSERIPATLALAGVAIALTIAGGVTIGMLAAAQRGGAADLLLISATTLGLALPSYWVALLLVLVFSVHLRWLPVLGAGSLAHLVLPALTLALPGIAMVGRLVRSSILEVSGADYVRTALAKGLSWRRVLVRHVMPNSLIPTLTMLGLYIGHLVGGAFVVETIFAWPGLGRLTVQAIFDRDIPVVMGAVLVVAPLSILVNLAVDLLHGALDPRLRHETL